MGFTYDYRQVERDAASRGWDGKELARQADVSAMTVSRFFRGHPIAPRTAKKLASALGRSLKRYTPEMHEATQ